MKILLSYACDLEDIPKTVAELLGNLKENYISLVEIDVQNAILYSNEKNISEALDSIDQARIQLAKIDNRLMDYSGILAGYSKTNADVQMGVVDVNDPQLEEMQEQLKEIKNHVDTQNQKETND